MAAIIVFGDDFVSVASGSASFRTSISRSSAYLAQSPRRSPEVIESQVLDPLEDAIMEIDGIRSVTSTANQSSGSIAVEFELNRDIDKSMQEIQNKINQVANLLPVNLFPPTVRKEQSRGPADPLACAHRDGSERQADRPDDLCEKLSLRPVFSTVPGSGNIVLGGYVDPALRVWTDLDKLDHFNLTNETILTAIKARARRNSGRADQERRTRSITSVPWARPRSPEEYRKIVINSRAGQGPNYKPTHLNQIVRSKKDRRTSARSPAPTARLAIGLGIIKQHGSNAVRSRQRRSSETEGNPPLDSKANTGRRAFRQHPLHQTVRRIASIFTLMLSALLDVDRLLSLLGILDVDVQCVMAIPDVDRRNLHRFFSCGFTLNTFTLLGLSLAIGIVVDDAIMMLENIVRHRELGEEQEAKLP